jgi:hypothetical protein
VELTAAGDGLSHCVTESAYREGLTAGSGRYRTLCGRIVLATAMMTAPGPACRTCRDTVRSTPGDVDRPPRRRRPRR